MSIGRYPYNNYYTPSYSIPFYSGGYPGYGGYGGCSQFGGCGFNGWWIWIVILVFFWFYWNGRCKLGFDGFGKSYFN